MGRYYFDKKATVEECKSISVYFLKKHGYFSSPLKSGGITWSTNGHSRGDVSFSVNRDERYIRFFYTSTDKQTQESLQKDYQVRLTTSPCHLGGVRYWFQCPFCNKRTGTLHLCGKSDFACRQCLKLSYESRNDNKKFRGYKKFFDLEELHIKTDQLKTKYYNGKETRKFQQLQKKISLLSRYSEPCPF